MPDDVQFDEDDSLDYARPVKKAKKRTSLLTQAALGLGLATDEKDAQRVMLITALVLIGASAAFYFIGTTPKSAPATAAQVEQSLNP